MKSLFVVSALIFAFSATAGEKINCISLKSPANRLQIILTEQSTIAGASLYNLDANQTAEETFVAILAAGSVNPMAGIQVLLQDKNVLDIEYAVFDQNHDGLVIVNDIEEYHCK